jgi:predicted HTH transcriptional regulator
VATDAIIQRLDKLIAILQLAHQDAIEEARVRILSDKVNKAVLELAADWTSAGDLKKAAMQKTKQSQPTVERRIAGLVAQGVLEKQGAGGNVSYKSTGLI